MHSKVSPLPLIVFVTSTVLFGAAALFAYGVDTRATLRLVLPFEYIVLAAASVWYLKTGGIKETSSFPSFKRVAVIAAAGSVISAAAVSFWLRPTMMIADEDCYRFQGRIYASGRLVADPMPGATARTRDTPRYLSFEHDILTPKAWYAMYTPGWPLALALGDLLHADWLVNPLLGLLLLYLSGQVAFALFGDPIRWLTVLLMALSPYFFTQAYTQLSHMLCAVVTAAATLLFIRWIEREKLVYLFGGIAAIGFNFQVRPYSALVVAITLSLGLLYHHRANRRLFRIDLLILTLGGALAIAAFLFYQYLYTGHWWLSPYAVSQGRLTPGEMTFTVKQITNGLLRFRLEIQDTLTAVFPCFGWLLVAGIVFRSERHPNLPGFARAVLLLYPMFMLFHISEPQPSWGNNGERYFFEAYFSLAILAARGLEEIALRWQAPPSRVRVVTIAFSIVMAPILAGSAIIPSTTTLPYHRMSIALQPLLHASGQDAIVFLQSSPNFKAHFFNINAADWKNAPVIAIGDPGPANREQVARAFGRRHWFIARYDERGREAIILDGGAISLQ